MSGKVRMEVCGQFIAEFQTFKTSSRQISQVIRAKEETTAAEGDKTRMVMNGACVPIFPASHQPTRPTVNSPDHLTAPLNHKHEVNQSTYECIALSFCKSIFSPPSQKAQFPTHSSLTMHTIAPLCWQNCFFPHNLCAVRKAL